MQCLGGGRYGDAAPKIFSRREEEMLTQDIGVDGDLDPHAGPSDGGPTGPPGTAALEEMLSPLRTCS